MLDDEFKKNNEEKYHSKEFDHISDMYRTDVNIGHIWCIGNTIKYCKRFISKSKKAYNLVDLKKALDYLTRAIEVAEKQSDINKKEIIEESK